jgi:hypothetical protein
MILMALPLLVMACGEPDIEGASLPEGEAEGHGGGHGEEEAHGPAFEESYTLEMGTEPVVVYFPEGWVHEEIESILPGAAEGALEIANRSELVGEEDVPELSSGDLLMQFQIIVGEGLDTETLPSLLNAMRSLSVGDFTSSYVVEYPRLRELGTHSAATAWYEGTLGDEQAAEAVQITMMLSQTDLLVINAVFPPREYNDHREEIFDIASAVQSGEDEAHGEEEHAGEEADEGEEEVGATEREDLPDADATLAAAAAEAEATSAAQATASAEASEVAAQVTATAVSMGLAMADVDRNFVEYTAETALGALLLEYPEDWTIQHQEGSTQIVLATSAEILETPVNQLPSGEMIAILEVFSSEQANQAEGFSPEFPLEQLMATTTQIAEEDIIRPPMEVDFIGYPAAMLTVSIPQPPPEEPGEGTDEPDLAVETLPFTEDTVFLVVLNEGVALQAILITPPDEMEDALPVLMRILQSMELN